MNLAPWFLYGALLLPIAPPPSPPPPHGGETLEEAAERLFPGCRLERQTAYLDDDEKERVRTQCGTDCRGVVYPYHVKRDGRLLATLYLDRHTVRSKRETVLVAVSPNGSVHSVTVLQFAEPKRYLPPSRWYRQMQGKSLQTPPRLGRNVDGMSGATLTTRAGVQATHRILAIHGALGARTQDQRP